MDNSDTKNEGCNHLYNDDAVDLSSDALDDVKSIQKLTIVKQYNGKRKPPKNNHLPVLKPKPANHSNFFNTPFTTTVDEIIDLDTIDSSYSSDNYIQTDINNVSPFNELSSNTTKSCLSECALEAMDKQNPGMTARERVLNWRIAKSWPRLDSILDEDQSYSTRTDELKSNTHDSSAMFRLKPSLLSNCHASPLPPTIDFVDSSTVDPLKSLQKYQQENPMPSIIKVRLTYGKDDIKQRKTLFKVPDAPVSRTDGENSLAEDMTVEVANEETAADNADGADKPLTISSASPAEPPNSKCESPTSPTSNKEEFYKYLGIDTTPCHEKMPSIDKRSTGDLISGVKRRSLRVKVQQIAINNIAKFNKQQENKVLEAVGKRTAANRSAADGDGAADTSQESSQSSKKRSSSLDDALSFKSGNSTEKPDIENKMADRRRNSNGKLSQSHLATVNGALRPRTVSGSERNEAVSAQSDNDTLKSKKPSELGGGSSTQRPTMQPLIKHTYKPAAAPMKPIENRRSSKQYRSICMTPQSPPVVMSPTVTSTIKQQKSLGATQNTIQLVKSSVLERRDYNKGGSAGSAPIPTEIANRYYRCKILSNSVSFDHQYKRFKSGSPIDCAGTIDGKPQNSETVTRANCISEQQQSTYIGIRPMTVDSTTAPAEEMPSSSSAAAGVLKNNGTSGPTMSDKQKALKQLFSMKECEAEQKMSMVRRKLLRETIAQTKQSLRRCSHRSKKLVLSSRNFKKNASSFMKRKFSKLASLACINRGLVTLSPTVKATAQRCETPTPSTPQSCAVAAILDSGLESDAVKLSDIDQSDVPVDRSTISTTVLLDDVAKAKERDDAKTLLLKCEVRIHRYSLEDVTGEGRCQMLAVLYTNNTIITVSESFIYFWMCPSRIYTTFANDEAPHWKMIGSIERDKKDVEIQSPYQNRICHQTSSNVAYFELRAKEFKPNETRECYLTAVYVNVYMLDKQNKPAVRHVDLDRLSCESSSIKYVVLPDNGKFAMSWTEQLQNRRRCGVCRYSLGTDLELLDEIEEFPLLQHSVNSLACLDGDKLFGFGNSTVTMWNHRTGDLMLNIDLEYDIGYHLGGFLLNEMNEKCLFFAQYYSDTEMPSIRLIALNLTNAYRYTVVAEHKMPTKCKRISSISMTIDELVVIFQNGQSVYLSTLNPQQIFIHMPKFILNQQKNDTVARQAFVQNGRIYEIANDHQIVTRTIHEYFNGLCDCSRSSVKQ